MRTTISKRNKAAIDAAVRRINRWLDRFGLSVNLATADEDELWDREQCGEYEDGSVFTKTILACVCIPNIRAYCRDIIVPYSETSVRREIQATVYHEVGHALIEQINDWVENIPEAQALMKGDLGKRYEEVFDDGLDEEWVVEEFATAFLAGRPSVLRLCFEEMNEALSGI